MLHSSLKPADAVLTRLDDKSYGAVSVGYLAFGQNIQGVISAALKNLQDQYSIRRDNAPKRDLPDVTIFSAEVKRAACDNLIEATRFSMLTELVDTALINNISDTGTGHEGAAAPAPLVYHAPLPHIAGRAPATTKAHLMKAGLITQAGMDVDAPTPARPSDAPPSSPLSVYVVHEWMARQQLLTQKMAAKSAGAAAAEQARPNLFPDI